LSISRVGAASELGRERLGKSLGSEANFQPCDGKNDREPK